MDDSFIPWLDAEHVRRSLIETRIEGTVIGYIQYFHTLVYKVSMMTQDEAFSQFMSEIKAQGPGIDCVPCEGDLGKAMEMEM